MQNTILNWDPTEGERAEEKTDISENHIEDLSLQHTYLECLLSLKFPPAAVNGLFDLLLPQGQVLQELQRDPIQNTKELSTERFHHFNLFLFSVVQVYRLNGQILQLSIFVRTIF